MFCLSVLHLLSFDVSGLAEICGSQQLSSVLHVLSFDLSGLVETCRSHQSTSDSAS